MTGVECLAAVADTLRARGVACKTVYAETWLMVDGATMANVMANGSFRVGPVLNGKDRVVINSRIVKPAADKVDLLATEIQSRLAARAQQAEGT